MRESPRLRLSTPVAGDRRAASPALNARSAQYPRAMAAAAAERTLSEDARYTAEAAEHAKSAAWIPVGSPAAAAAAARLRAADAEEGARGARSRARGVGPGDMNRPGTGGMNRPQVGDGDRDREDDKEGSSRRASSRNRHTLAGGGGGGGAAAWMRELRSSGNLFTPRTAEHRVWDGAVAATRDAAETSGAGRDWDDGGGTGVWSGMDTETPRTGTGLGRGSRRGTGRGLATDFDPVLHHARGYHSAAIKRPGTTSTVFARRLVLHAPGSPRTETSPHGRSAAHKPFSWPEFH